MDAEKLQKVAEALQATPEIFTEIVDWHNQTIESADSIVKQLEEAKAQTEQLQQALEQEKQLREQQQQFNAMLMAKVPLKDFAKPEQTTPDPMEVFLKGLDNDGLKKKW